MLFIRSDIYNCPEIDKLKRYIEANQITLIGNTKNEHLIINAGLSDDDILDSLVSEIIFNKLLTKTATSSAATMIPEQTGAECATSTTAARMCRPS
jgi:hypothetical protein